MHSIGTRWALDRSKGSHLSLPLGVTEAPECSLGVTGAPECSLGVTGAPECSLGVTEAPECSLGVTEAPEFHSKRRRRYNHVPFVIGRASHLAKYKGFDYSIVLIGAMF